MEELGRLPGIGPKTAQRLSFYILRTPRESVDRLAAALTEVKARIRFCNDCFFIAEGEQCTICLSPRRDRTVLCVVEEPLDVLAIERTGEYHGLYHVLHGALSPIDGVGSGEPRGCWVTRRTTSSTASSSSWPPVDERWKCGRIEFRKLRPGGCTRTWRRTSSSGFRNFAEQPV